MISSLSEFVRLFTAHFLLNNNNNINNNINNEATYLQCLVSHVLNTHNNNININNVWQGYVSCMFSYDALLSSFVVCVGFIVYSFVWSILGNNVSKVDQIWSITPVVYAWHFYYYDLKKNELQGHSQSLFVMAILITLWGIRLTYNFWRRGGYGNLITHEEDYRWPIIRKKINNPVLFFIFNLTFIASFQNALLWLIVVPMYTRIDGPRGMESRDIALAAVFVLLLITETLADQQQWDFQSVKYALTPEERKVHPSKDIRDGFLQSGLFKYSRHPNYFSELSIWTVVYLFSTSGNEILNWTVIGIALLIALFNGSVTFSESITAEKYPAYKVFQQTTSRLLPLWSAAAKEKSK